MKRNDERKFYILSTVTILALLTVIIIFLAAIFAAGIMIVFNTIKKQPQKVIEAEVEEEEVESDTKVTISIDEWIGWKTLIDANGGLITAPDSINARNGINIEYVVISNATTSSDSLIKGEVQGAGYTVNQYAFLQSKFKDEGIEVVMPFICSYSDGADGIITKSDIKTISDLVGKSIAVAKYSDDHTMLEWLISHSDLTEEEQKQIRSGICLVETSDDAAVLFFRGEVDAAVTWEPYLMDADGNQSRVLFDTSEQNNLILDGIVFRTDFIKDNEDFIVRLIDGALEAADMYKDEVKYIRQVSPLFEYMSDEEIIDSENGIGIIATCYQNEALLAESAVQMYRDMAEVWLTMGEPAYPQCAEKAFSDKYIRQLLEKKY